LIFLSKNTPLINPKPPVEVVGRFSFQFYPMDAAVAAVAPSVLAAIAEGGRAQAGKD
jgi:hypothetical protein